MSPSIRPIDGDADLTPSCEVIRASFATVAADLGLTRENCPSHPAFITTDSLAAARARGVAFFGLFLGAKQAGFIAVERVDDRLYYIERLAVLPAHRHQGFGRMLMDFAFGHIREHGGKRVSIGIIDENCVLKEWYLAYGFIETGTKRFEHLPFTVCFMEMDAL